MEYNQHIKEYLKYYLSEANPPEYAVMIDGKWGSGKTHFVRGLLDKDSAFQESSTYLYVSLYGVTKTAQIDSELFRQLHPILGSKGAKLAGRIFSGLVKTTIKVDIDRDGDSDGSMTFTPPDIKLPEYLNDVSNRIIVFDDLERCPMPINEVLGYINSFVEHQGLKVIVIANEQEILDYCDENSKTEQYQRIKEKLIGKTFTVTPPLEAVIQTLEPSIENQHLLRLIEKSSGIIRDYFSRSKCGNLRHLRWALTDFAFLLDCLPRHAKPNTELLNSLLKLFLLFSFEVRSGNLDSVKILNLKNEHITSSLNKESVESPSTLSVLNEKYICAGISSPILSFNTWHTIFGEGYFPQQQIVDEINSYTDSNKYQESAWFNLWRFNDLSEAEFEIALKKGLDELDKQSFTELGAVKHMISNLICIVENGLCELTVDEVISLGEKNVEHLANIGTLESESPVRPYNSTVNSSYMGYGFLSRGEDIFEKFLNYCDHQVVESHAKSFEKKAEQLLELAKSDPEEYLRLLIVTNFNKHEYHDQPILAYIDRAIFLRVFIESKPQHRRVMAYVFKERYTGHPDTDKYLLPEFDWLNDIIQGLQSYIDTKPSSVTSFQIKHLLEGYLLPGRDLLKKALSNE